MTSRFRDRAHAGELLAFSCLTYAWRHDVVVLGLLRGGVPVARRVADALGAPLGAFGAGGLRRAPPLGVPPRALPGAVMRWLIDCARSEWGPLSRLLAGGGDDDDPPDLRGRSVVLVDDRLTSSGAMIAAARAVRDWGARRVACAVPVALRDPSRAVAAYADEWITLHAVTTRRQLAGAYASLPPVSDAEAARLLRARAPWAAWRDPGWWR